MYLFLHSFQFAHLARRPPTMLTIFMSRIAAKPVNEWFSRFGLERRRGPLAAESSRLQLYIGRDNSVFDLSLLTARLVARYT